MLLNVRARCLNHADHRLFSLHPKGQDLSQAKQHRSNRLAIQAYLYRVQQRLNRGAFAGAEFLFNRMCALFNLQRWESVAASGEIRMTPEARAAYQDFRKARM